MKDWLNWLNQNSGAVTAIVTAIYTVFTLLLWWATRRQAALTKRTFEAANRPYVSLLAQEDDPGGPDAVSFTVVIENVGSVPANVTDWEAWIEIPGQGYVPQVDKEKAEATLIGACFFPHRESPMAVVFHKPGILRTPDFQMVAFMNYRGISMTTTYMTRVEVRRTPTEQRQRTRAT